MNDPHSVTRDPVIDEIRKIRDELSERFHGDIHAMAEEMRRQAAASGKPGITRPAKPVQKAPAENSPKAIAN